MPSHLNGYNFTKLVNYAVSHRYMSVLVLFYHRSYLFLPLPYPPPPVCLGRRGQGAKRGD
jgi:hypothetical protein